MAITQITSKQILGAVVNASAYGASATATATVNATAIQAALNTGYSVILPVGTLDFNATLRFKSHGQILSGQGAGDNSNVWVTGLKWTGAANGKMISWYDGTTQHWGNCSVRDLAMNGNALANIGLHMYEDAYTGGCWRQEVTNVFIEGVTNGSSPTNIYAGAGTGNDNSNDFRITSVHTYGGAYGIQSGGAQGSMQGHCTWESATVAGAKFSVGANCDIGNSLFISNAVDIIANNANKITGANGRCEQSTTTVYQGATGHNFSLFGYYLDTNGIDLMDFGSCAGSHALVGCTVAVGSPGSIVNVNASATGIIQSSGGAAFNPTYVTTGAPVPQIISQAAYTALSSLLVNSWVDYGAGLQVSGYTLDVEGYVHLRGAIKSGTVASGTTLFTLPAGYRPAAPQVFPVVSNKLPCSITISSAGVVGIESTAASTIYITLSGVSFRTAP